MTIYELPETIALDEEGHVDDHIVIHTAIKQHEDRIREVESNKSDGSHKHIAEDLTDATDIGTDLITAETAEAARSVIGAGTSSIELGTTPSTAKSGDYRPTWGEVIDKPSEFNPTTHNHTLSQVTGLDAALTAKANKDHAHAITEVTGLQGSLTDITNSIGTSTGNIASIEGDVQNLQADVLQVENALPTKANLVSGKIPTSEIPAIALTKPSSVTSRADLLALVAEEGDVGIITTGPDKGTYMLGAGASNNFSSWIALATSTEVPVQSVNGQIGTVNLSYSDVGASPTSHSHVIGNITGLQAELNNKAGLISGKLDPSQLPSANSLTGELSSNVNVSNSMVLIELDLGDEGPPESETLTMHEAMSGLYHISYSSYVRMAHPLQMQDSYITNGLVEHPEGSHSYEKLGVVLSELQQDLSGKADVGHTHTWSQISNAPAYSKDATGDNLVQRAANGHINVPAGAGAQNAIRRSEVDAAINAKIQLVTEFPASPTAGVLYLKAE